MTEDNYKLKYIKYKKKYIELKKMRNNLKNITNKIIILPNEYKILEESNKNKFEIYELDDLNKPISYLKKEHKIKLSGGKYNEIDKYDNRDENIIIEKLIITPDEYFLLSDSNKSKYEINESDYDKFPNRVVPKNFKKINNN